MQDIDFGRLYKSQRKHHSSEYRSPLHEKDNNYRSPLFRTSTFLIFLFLFAFTIGLASGVYIRESKDSYNRENIQGKKYLLSKNQNTNEFASANIGNSQNNSLNPYREDFDSIKFPANEVQENPSSASSPDDILENETEAKNNNSDLLEENTVKSNDSYLIWAKTYENKQEAYRYGLALKKKGLPVFLARSGARLKIYVGPIHGKNEAYQMLAKVKSFLPFKGAILHKKTN